MTVATADDSEILTQEKEVVRGRRAEALMRDPLVSEALETMDQAFYQAFRDTDPVDLQTLSRIRLLIKCLDEFKGFFSTAIETGKLTQVNIDLGVREGEALERLERQRLTR